MRVTLDVVRGREAPCSLVLDAASLNDACRRARREGYAVLDARPAGGGWWGAAAARCVGAWSGGPGVSRADAVVLAGQLRDLLIAGLSLIEALETLRHAAPERARPVAEALMRELRGGRRLSEALAAQDGFSPLLVALVRASELTSDLPAALSRYVAHEQRVAELKHRVASLAVYPLLLTVVGSGVLAFLLFYVMPRFARVFEGMGGDLPWSARAMVAWSHWLGAHGVLLGAAGAALLLASGWLLAMPPTRLRAMRVLTAWGPLHRWLHMHFLAGWYRSAGMLASGGIPLPEAVALANGLLPLHLRTSGEAVVQGLRDGASPSQAHLRAHMATPVAAQLLRAGERTGGLGEVLERVASFHDAELTRGLEQLVRSAEPLVMVLIGLGVGVVVVLMYMPIFELAAAIR